MKKLASTQTVSIAVLILIAISFLAIPKLLSSVMVFVVSYFVISIIIREHGEPIFKASALSVILAGILTIMAFFFGVIISVVILVISFVVLKYFKKV